MNMAKKNRKALLLPEVISLIIAVIGISLVIFGLRYLYSNSYIDQETRSAQYLADKMQTILDSVKDKETTDLTIRGIFSPENTYFLTGWSVTDKKRPQKCYLNSCVCVCKADCQKDGFCRKISSNIEIKNRDYFYVPPAALEGGYHLEGSYEEVIKPEIPLPGKLISLNLEKKDSTITISHFTKIPEK